MSGPVAEAAAPFVADTHIFVWYVNNSRRLSAAAGATLDAATAAGSPILLSAVSLVELRYLVEKGTFTEAEFDSFTEALSHPDSPFDVAPFEADMASFVDRVPRSCGGDPFDRMIVATAAKFGVPLVTADKRLRNLDTVETIW